MEAKRCGRCGSTKPMEDFAWRRIKKGQHDNYCRPCRADYKQEHYRKNRQRYIDQAAARNRRELRQRAAFIASFLEEHPCVDCGEADIRVLEFDHVDKKSFGIADGFRFRKWSDVLAEIAKCEVVCANCHRRRTARRGGFFRSQWAGAVSEQRRLID